MSIPKDNSFLGLPAEPEEFSLFQNDSNSLIDYKKFWKFVNQKYFADNLPNSFAKLALLISKLSDYGKL